MLTPAQIQATIDRFRVHGFTYHQAVIMAAAIEHAMQSAEFKTLHGSYGVECLKTAIQDMPLSPPTKRDPTRRVPC